jgi:WD40 repeat protein
MDTRDIAAGATWSKEIEQALDYCDVTLALLTHGSYISEICRAEQLRALRLGKCVIPLRCQSNSEIPLHLEAKQYLDFSAPSAYQDRFAALLEDVGTRQGIELKPEYRATRYDTVPPFPANYVERPQELAALRNAVITEGGGRTIALTALEGMGGIGKTVLAQGLCHEEVVQQAFPDGIIWITAGKESAYDLVTRMREVAKGLSDDLTRYDTELGCKNQYRTTIRNKAALIVIDDVWRARDLEPFRAESPRSRLLFTTRDADIAAATGAREHSVNLLDEEQSREVLAGGIGPLPAEGYEIIHECGRLPLALAMVAAMLRSKPHSAWKRVLNQLQNSDLEKIRAEFPIYPHTDLLRAIQVSIEALDDVSRRRYLALAVLLEDMPVHPAIQRTLWNVDESEAEETSERFISRALAQRDKEGIRLHDLQLDYVRAQYPEKPTLQLIHEAARLSSHLLQKDSGQFASQLIGRLLSHIDQPAIRAFIDALREGAPRPALLPLHPTLHPPGTPLVRTLSGHSRTVNAVALSADGRLAVSASDDGMLKVWNVDTGRELRSLKGHSGAVYGVALSADGRRAVSASSDKTLKVWDVDSGRELLTLREHSDAVYAVALSTDGRRAVSASGDDTLKVWDVESGRELRTLAGHNASVAGVALSADGQRAVSASDDLTLKVWDVEGGRELCTLKGHADQVRGVALRADGRRAVSASIDETLKVWDMENGRELRTLAGHSGGVTAVALSPDGGRAVSGSGDGTLKIWDVESGRELRALKGHAGMIAGVALSPDGRRAVSASYDSTLKVWDMESGREVPTLAGHSGSVNGMALSANGRRAVSASEDRTLKVWDVESGRELRPLAGRSSSVHGVALSTDGRRAVSASWYHTLNVWDVESRRELRTLAGHTASVHGVALSADGQRAVSASWDQTEKVWDVESGRELRTLRGHSNHVNGVALSADGRRAVSACYDQTVKVWDVESGRVLATFTCDSAARSCAIAANYPVIAADLGGSVHFLQFLE